MMSDFRKAIDRPNGIVLVTGPTGSGKTTTLYSALTELNDIKDKLITTEDPGRIRHRRHHSNPDRYRRRRHVCQLSAGDLAARPRHDSGRRDSRLGDGRDRDPSGADRSPGLQHAAHQRRPGHGHAVEGHGHPAVHDLRHRRSHFGPAVGAPDLHQVPRRNQSQHVDAVRPGHEARRHRGQESSSRAPAAINCNNTGYKGRIALFELMMLNDKIRDMVMGNASTDELRDEARKTAWCRCENSEWHGRRRHHDARRNHPRNRSKNRSVSLAVFSVPARSLPNCS